MTRKVVSQNILNTKLMRFLQVKQKYEETKNYEF